MIGNLITIIIFLHSIYLLKNKLRLKNKNNLKSLTIVVLGDIGRSPRMLFHSKSLIQNGFVINIVAYKGSKPPKELIESPNVNFIYLPTPMPWVSNLPRPLFLLLSPFKVLVMTFNLLWALLFRIEFASSFILSQNPPAIPTLPIVKLVGFLRGSKIIIDWHNTGYSVLALRLGDKSPVVRFAKWIEITFGRNAYAQLCVTEAMRKNLIRDAGLTGKIVVFHDRPPASFRKQTVEESHELFSRLPVFSTPSILEFFNQFSNPSPSSSTIFSSSSLPDLLLQTRPALLISSTSWTADEDFLILLTALESYELKASLPKSDLPKLMIVITGKGTLKEAFEKEVESREGSWNFVRVRTSWLELDDYPKLLGSADLGISLHASTSGADLPMKVVDMFGCNLPVCALDFACVDELVQNGVNGTTFKDSYELCEQLESLLSGFPANTSKLDSLRGGIMSTRYGEGQEKWSTWEENWKSIVEPVLSL